MTVNTQQNEVISAKGKTADKEIVSEAAKNYELINGGKIFQILAILAFGATIFTSGATKSNPFYIGFGIIVFLIFTWLYKGFLKTFLGIFNPAVKKEVGKDIMRKVVDNSMLFLIPFAMMSLMATFLLRWTISTAFISTGIMTVGTAASIEVGKLLNKPAIKNTIITSAVSLLFSFILTMSIQLLVKIPGLLQGGIDLLMKLGLKGGGGL